MSSHRLLERAFALADSGGPNSTADIRAALIREGFTYAECFALTGNLLARQLKKTDRCSSPTFSGSQLAQGMPRALKTFVTNLGFFELAIAAPSMKAALEAWGMSHNAFQHGFAKQTDDPEIIAATTASPGVVLKRAVGTTGSFTENAALPRALPTIKPALIENRPRESRRSKSRPKPSTITKNDPTAVISFEKARAKRDKERAAEEAKLEKKLAARRHEIEEVEAELVAALAEHAARLADIATEREKLDTLTDRENKRWEVERKKLEDALNRVKRG